MDPNKCQPLTFQWTLIWSEFCDVPWVSHSTKCQLSILQSGIECQPSHKLKLLSMSITQPFEVSTFRYTKRNWVSTLQGFNSRGWHSIPICVMKSWHFIMVTLHWPVSKENQTFQLLRGWHIILLCITKSWHFILIALLIFGLGAYLFIRISLCSTEPGKFSPVAQGRVMSGITWVWNYCIGPPYARHGSSL